jgi:hypothetical protein
MTQTDCPCCGAKPGEWHRRGCDVEQCPHCGGQAVRCDSNADPIPLDDRLRWTGQWPGEAEAVEFRWYARLTPKGWRSCRPEAHGAMPDLNRVRRGMTWDRAEKRFARNQNSRSRS